MEVEARGNDEPREINKALSCSAEEYENNPDVELMWVIKATEHMEIYFNLLCSIDPQLLKLTPHDDRIYESFRKEFPDMSVDVLDEKELKSEEAKAKWRPYCNSFENVVEDFNFGTLVRIDSSKDYSKENTVLVPRIQFYAIEVARNREGFNNSIRKNYQPVKKQKENSTNDGSVGGLQSNLQDFIDDFCKDHKLSLVKISWLLRKEAGNCERGDFSLFCGNPSTHCLKSYLREIGEALPRKSGNWQIPINNCKLLPSCRLQLFLDRGAAFRNILSHVTKTKDYGRYCKTKFKTVLVNVVLEDDELGLREWRHLRTNLIGQYISTVINNNRCKVYFAIVGAEDIQMDNKVNYIKCTEICKTNEAEDVITKRLRASHYLEPSKDGAEIDFILNASKFLEDRKIPIGSKGYDKNIRFISSHSESWKQMFKWCIKLQHIFDKHVNEPDILIHVVPSNRSYFQQQLSIMVDMLCSKGPKRQTIVTHGPILFPHAPIQMENYTNRLKDEFEKSLVHKYGEEIVSQQWKKEYLNTLSDTVLKFEMLALNPSIPVKIRFSEDKGISVVEKTGTFLQYNYARLSMLFWQFENKVNAGQYPALPPIENVNFSLLTLEEEWNLLFNYIFVFPQVTSVIFEELESSTLKLEIPVHKVCHFLINLVRDLSMYYSRIHILTEPRPHLMQIMFARLWLLKGVQRIIYNTFKLFNILPLEKM
ncbi:DALR anticodon-binding domain-containing protein 3-like isoform X1 [Centruroides sculpturatus]|uniref:DALR anticodon-binding domain-containing protein 3-like isoform X1 n=1 Tax=Centruroides sculpturatus TaxID=218467 RepID=UPI000C6D10CC|nr:DALR anticodon-binding domain-containing protein 3-like isoform X1 [Centruroides sculpturatus]XP_023226945.1 DALR anticodon-binding domain-containing protein 3-like isoform X1 [Centruroides sculpturatus]